MVGRVMSIIGVLLFLVFVAADWFGIGGPPGIGWKPVAGMVFGVAVAALGMTNLRSPGR
jgi:hypothetical protein